MNYTDGAQYGVRPQAALGRAIADAPVGDDDVESVATTITRLATIDVTKKPTTYEDTCDVGAALVYRWLLEDPRRASTPDWYKAAKADGVPLRELGLSGFQWGWIENTVRRCIELPEVPNPAILEVRSEP